MRYIRQQITATLLSLFCATVAYAQPSQPAAVPKLVRFTGSFRPANGSPAQTMESVTLSVYRDQNGGEALWHEVQNVVVDSDGHYSVLMGATKNEGMPVDLFTSGEPRWLGVQFNRPGEAEQPRTLLVSVPYALKSVDADTLGGKPASAYMLTAPGPAGGADAASVAGVTASTTTTATGVKPKATPANNGQPNYIGKFTNTTDLIDSAMYEINGNVGIFTTTPAISLDVRTGSLPQMGIAGKSDYLTFFASDKFGPAIYWDPALDMRFGKGGVGLYNPFGFVEYLRIQSATGNVGIGTQTPGSKLEVDSAATGNAAIQGIATATSGSTAGAGGQSFSPNGTGVAGLSLATTGGNGGTFISQATSGPANGVFAQTASANGNGVFGQANAISGNTNGVLGLNTAISGFAVGVNGQTNSPTGTGVNGVNNATSGGTAGTFISNATSGGANGVLAQTASANGNGVFAQANAISGNNNGVFGFNAATSGFAVGVNGQTNSPNGTGVNGMNLATSGGVGGTFISQATSGNATGVFGQTASTGTGSAGVVGTATATSGNTNGVFGSANSPNGQGVFGLNNATSGFAQGVTGVTNSPNGTGVNGVNNATSGGSGGNFTSNATSGFAVGVNGQSASTNGVGVFGNATASSGFALGVQGATNSPNGAGVLGINNGTGGGFGLDGQSGTNGVAVFGVNQTCNNSGCTLVNGIGGQFMTGAGGTVLSGFGGSFSNQVFYVDASGNGFFAGNLNVTGKVTKGSGSFKIDHPLDPANKYLSHSFVESPDMMNVYNGMTKLDAKGEAWVNLPDYFEALNGDFRYQLTAIGAPAPRLYVAQEVQRNRFKIAGGRAGGRVSWQVTGIRHDAYANANRIPVTEEKPPAEQGRYLHPDVFGQGAVTIAH